jgi:hypothetical protein
MTNYDPSDNSDFEHLVTIILDLRHPERGEAIAELGRRAKALGFLTERFGRALLLLNGGSTRH